MKKHHGKWWRIPEIANAVDLSVPAVNNALYIMQASECIERTTRRKRINGKEYPLYMMHNYEAPTLGPSWISPMPPSFTEDQIKGMRTVLGFTGNLKIKKVLKDHK